MYAASVEAGTIPFEEEILTAIQQLNEHIMITLRTKEGIDLETLERKFGAEKKETILSNSNSFLRQGMLETDTHYLRITKKGRFLADGIAATLFF